MLLLIIKYHNKLKPNRFFIFYQIVCKSLRELITEKMSLLLASASLFTKKKNRKSKMGQNSVRLLNRTSAKRLNLTIVEKVIFDNNKSKAQSFFLLHCKSCHFVIRVNNVEFFRFPISLVFILDVAVFHHMVRKHRLMKLRIFFFNHDSSSYF